MATVTLGAELIPPLDKINTILDTLPPVQRQQVIEMVLVAHLYRYSYKREMQRVVMDGICKHVRQLLDQAGKMENH